MGNLLKIASLGLFAAIGIASAVSVATHFQPATPTTQWSAADEDGGFSRGGKAPQTALLPAGSASSPQTTELPALTRPGERAAGPRDAHAVAVQVALPKWQPVSAAATSALETSASQTASSETPTSETPPVAAPALIPPSAPILGDAIATNSPLETGPTAADRQRADQALAQPLNAFVASYQPLVTAQFDLMRDAIGRIAQTQERTAQLVSQLQDGQNQANRSVEIIPPPPGTAAEAQGVEPNVKMKDDKLTLIFQKSDIKAALNQIGIEAKLNILASESVTGLVTATLTDVDIKTALSAILKSRGLVSHQEGNIVYVGTQQELDFVQHGEEIANTRIYHPNYVAALDIQTLITPLLTKGTGQVTISTASEVGIAPDSSSAGGNSFTGEEVVIVRDFEGVLAQIDDLIAKVDVMPRQVAIEAMILSVTLDDKNEMGVDFELLRRQDTIRVTSGTPLLDLSTGPFKDGLKIGFLDSSVFMFLNALETIGDTNVVASPRVMCLNKQRAEILIGSQLGYVSTTITETAATQSVQFLEVGTQLSIRPFISSEGMIRMEVHPELSTGSVRVESGFTLPDKEVTQVTTNVMCPDGATVVIGGLIREDLVTTATQIPVLGNLPWVGPAFRQKKEEIARREIIVLLTPRIVQQEDLWNEGQAYSQQFKDRRGVFVDKMSPLGGAHIADRYFRKATAAWSAGDADTALRHCNLAIQNNSLHKGAVALRGEILSVAPELETAVHEHLRHGLAPLHPPARDYSKQGYPWRTPDYVPAEICPDVFDPELIEPEPIDSVPTRADAAAAEPSAPPVHTIEIGPPARSRQ